MMSEKLTIQDLARGAAEKLNMTKGNAEEFVREFFQLIADALHQDKYVKVKGLGTFKLIEVDSRASVNIKTGERFEIQSHTKVSFTPDAGLRDVINRPFAHFESVPLQNEELLLTTTVEEEASQQEDFAPVEEQMLAEETPVAEETPETEETPVEGAGLSEKQSVTEDTHAAEQQAPVEEEVHAVAEQAPVEEEVRAAAEEAPVDEEVHAVVEEAPEEVVLPTDEVKCLVDEAIDAPCDEETPAPLEDDYPPLEEMLHHQSWEENPSDEKPSDEKLSEEELSEEEVAERKRTMKYFIGIVVFISLLCIGVLVFIYFPGLTRALYGLKAPVEQTVDSVNQLVVPSDQAEEAVDSLLSDTLRRSSDILRRSSEASEAAATITQPSALQPNASQSSSQKSAAAQPSAQKPAEATPFVPDSSNYEIVGTQESYTLKEGETLTRVALRFWGTKSLWPYLVKHNPTVIKNPDNVPYGTTIRIPKLKKK